MKHRIGLVSNSSSSSFIIGLPNPKCLHYDIDGLLKYLNLNLLELETILSPEVIAAYILGLINKSGINKRQEIDKFMYYKLDGFLNNKEFTWINGEPDCAQKLKDKYIKLYLKDRDTEFNNKKHQKEITILAKKIARQWAKNWLYKNNIKYDSDGYFLYENPIALYLFHQEDKGQFSFIEYKAYKIFKNILWISRSNH